MSKVAEKLVDGDFLAKLTAGSMESAIDAVDEAILANAQLFGADDRESVSTVATYQDYAIVANADGDFFRAKWALGEDGVKLSEVEEIDVPVYEAGRMGAEVRQTAIEAATALLGGDHEGAEEHLRSLYQMAKSGVRLTAEGVEDLLARQTFAEGDWFRAVREQESGIRGFLGGDGARLGVTKPQFETVTAHGISEDQAGSQRQAVKAAIGRLAEQFRGIRRQIALARQVTESHVMRGSQDSAMAAVDFVDFVGGFGSDLDAMVGILGDAQAVAEDGSVRCLARIHDAVAGQMYEWALAGAFCEKLARRFERAAA